MSGYVRERKVYRLRFDDPEMDGLVVRARGISTGEFLNVAGLAGVDVRKMGRDGLDKLFDAFAGALIDWNLEEPEGTPVPTTLEAIHAQEPDFVMTIIAAWIDALTGVPRPLGADSPNGKPSLEASIPMETRSSSRTS